MYLQERMSDILIIRYLCDDRTNMCIGEKNWVRNPSEILELQRSGLNATLDFLDNFIGPDAFQRPIAFFGNSFPTSDVGVDELIQRVRWSFEEQE